jgi:hypothetical protein
MPKDKYEIVEQMLRESQKIAKTGTPQELINALTAIEKYASQQGLDKFARAARQKLARMRKNLS